MSSAQFHNISPQNQFRSCKFDNNDNNNNREKKKEVVSKKKEDTLPEPRKPVMIVAGMRLSGGIMVETSEPSVWGGDVVVEATVNGRGGPLLGLGMLRGNNLEEEYVSNWE